MGQGFFLTSTPLSHLVTKAESMRSLSEVEGYARGRVTAQETERGIKWQRQ